MMSESVALWLVGAPGVGKTAVARSILGMYGAYTLHPSPKWTIGDGVVAAGHYTGSAFDGADTVPYSGAKAALDYWRAHLLQSARLTIFDGDRFSDAGCFERVLATDVSVRIVLLTASEDVLGARRSMRGSTQSVTWMKGRATKAARFARLDPGALRMESAGTPDDLATAILAALC